MMMKRIILWGLAALVCATCLADPPTIRDIPAPEKRRMNFDFDGVKVRTFVEIVGGQLKDCQFIVDGNVEGEVTVVSPPIPVNEVFPVFVSVLDSIGCSVVEESEGVYRIVSMGDRTVQVPPVVVPGETTPEYGVVTKVIRLTYASAEEMKKALEPRVRSGKAGGIFAVGNHIIVTDTVKNIARLEKIIEVVDKPGLARSTEVITLEYASAEETAQQLTTAMAGDEAEARRRTYARYSRSGPAGQQVVEEERRAVVVAAPHSNSLIIMGTPAQIVELQRIITLMDVDSPSGRGRLRAIFLQYIQAEEAAASLNSLLARGTATGRTGRSSRSGSETPISIQPHVANNALLIDAMPRDFDLVEELIRELDRPPEQVLIEVLIIEVKAKDELNVGVNMIAVDAPSEVGEDVIQGSSIVSDGAGELLSAVQMGLFPRGLSVGLAHGSHEDADGNIVSTIPGVVNIDAMRKEGSYDILSNIPLLAQNNKEASVNIVENIPMLKSTVLGSGTSRDIIQNIERVDVGIKMKFTPHINPGGQVLMTLNPSIEAIIDTGEMGGYAPTIARRELSTTVTVPDGETIVLSGLIREDQTETVRKVPILGSIPLLGWLFSHKVKGSEKTNLLVFVTPHIVTDRTRARAATESWADTTSLAGPKATVVTSGRNVTGERDDDSTD